MHKRTKVLLIISMLVVIVLIIFGKERVNVKNTSPPEAEEYITEQNDNETDEEQILSEECVTEFIEESEIQESSETSEDPVEKEDFVNVKDYIANIFIELKYATMENFTGQKIYDFSEAYLRYGTVKKLIEVQAALEEHGLSLKIWDAFRPTSAQYTLWEICPDATYVANPNYGFSSHSRGNTVDLTVVEKDGTELVMPTEFDDFSTLADRDYTDCSNKAKENAELLQKLMLENGFEAYFGEWWHFTDFESYPVEEQLKLISEE